MGAILGGTMRSPFTSVIFALELTRDVDALLPMLIASMVAHGFTVLVMKRSILTEKVARRGYHLTREYSVDPLEMLTLHEVMSTDVETIHPSMPARELLERYIDGGNPRRHQGFPVVDSHGNLVGIVTRSNLLDESLAEATTDMTVADVMETEPLIGFPQESCRSAAEKMAQAGVGRIPVVDAENPKRLVGIVTRSDLLKPRARFIEEEQRRERFFRPGRAAAQQ